jgi:hypothetical protein
LRKLLNAKSLNGEWGGVEFKFSGAAHASLKGFISRRISAADVRWAPASRRAANRRRQRSPAILFI